MASKESSLISSASEGDLAKVQNLIENHSCNINSQGAMNRSALHLASLYGKLEVVMYLVEKGANKDIKASSGEVPLHLATLNGHASVVEYLLSEGADWKITNQAGKKPADYARKPNMRKLFEDAEKGIFNAEDNVLNPGNSSNVPPPKKRAIMTDEKLIEELISAGYPRGDVLDAIYSLTAENKPISLATVMTLLEKKKSEKKESESKKEDKQEEDEDKNSCKICFEAQIDAIVIPCGHVCICLSCSKGLKQCPMCRNDISQVVKMYFA